MLGPCHELIACPMNVLDPSDDPAGCTNPFGNGLLRILALVRLLFEVDTYEVEALKPGEFEIAFDE